MPQRERLKDQWGNVIGPHQWEYHQHIDINKHHLRDCSDRWKNLQNEWRRNKTPLTTALALGMLATRIRAHHGSFADARAAWALKATDPQATALAEMRKLMDRDYQVMCLLRTHLRWPPPPQK